MQIQTIGGRKMIQPLKNRILVKHVKEKQTTTIGNFQMEEKEQQLTAVIYEVGPEVKTVFIGDQVIYAKYSGHTVVHDGETYELVSEDDVLGVIR